MLVRIAMHSACGRAAVDARLCLSRRWRPLGIPVSCRYGNSGCWNTREPSRSERTGGGLCWCFSTASPAALGLSLHTRCALHSARRATTSGVTRHLPQDATPVIRVAPWLPTSENTLRLHASAMWCVPPRLKCGRQPLHGEMLPQATGRSLPQCRRKGKHRWAFVRSPLRTRCASRPFVVPIAQACAHQCDEGSVRNTNAQRASRGPTTQKTHHPPPPSVICALSCGRTGGIPERCLFGDGARAFSALQTCAKHGTLTSPDRGSLTPAGGLSCPAMPRASRGERGVLRRIGNVRCRRHKVAGGAGGHPRMGLVSFGPPHRWSAADGACPLFRIIVVGHGEPVGVQSGARDCRRPGSLLSLRRRASSSSTAELCECVGFTPRPWASFPLGFGCEGRQRAVYALRVRTGAGEARWI